MTTISESKSNPIMMRLNYSNTNEELSPKKLNKLYDSFNFYGVKFNKRDESTMLNYIGSKTSREVFDNFGKIRHSLEFRDKSLFEMSAMHGVAMLEELNSLFKYYDMQSTEATAFLDAFSELDDEEMKILIEIRQAYGGKDSFNYEKYILASGLSLLSGDDQDNFIRAVHKKPLEIDNIYELAFSMTIEDRSKFLSAAANSEGKISQFLELTNKFGGDFLNKPDLNAPLFVGYSSKGKLRSFLGFNDHGPIFDNNVYDSTSINPPGEYDSNDTEAVKMFTQFLDIASKSGESVDGLLTLMDKFSFEDDSFGLFSFILGLKPENAENFVNAAADLETSDIKNLMKITKSFLGNDQKNFLQAAANSDDSYQRFINLLNDVGDTLISSFLSAAAKSGENMDNFIDMASNLNNQQLSEFLDFMNDLSEENAQNIMEKDNISAGELSNLSKEIDSLNKDEKNIIVDIIINKEMDINVFTEKLSNKALKQKEEFFKNFIEEFYEGVDEVS